MIARLLLLIVMSLFTLKTSARPFSIIHYQQATGFPGNYGYNIYQDHTGYIWISTENGLTRFNGYSFKLFTTKDGLPDNEIFYMNQDAAGRLWFCPFANTIGYIKNDRIYNQKNDQFLKSLRFRFRPNPIFFDSYGNTIIFTNNEATIIGKDESMLKVTLNTNGSQMEAFQSDSGNVDVIYDWSVYEYVNRSFKKVSDLTPMGKPAQTRLCFAVIGTIGTSRALPFLHKMIASKLPFYCDEEQLNRINYVRKISSDILAITRRDGCFLVDINTATIVDTLLYQYGVGPCMVSKDGSLWLGTHGKGIFQFIKSPIKSLKLPNIPASVLFIKAQENGMFCTLERAKFVEAFFENADHLKIVQIKNINNQESYQSFYYLGQNQSHEWIGCTNYTGLYKQINQKPFKITDLGYCKDVVEQDKHQLLIATSSGLVKFDKDKFTTTAILLQSRITSVAASDTTIYAGTLAGLFAGSLSTGLRQIFTSEDALNCHIIKLYQDDHRVLWVANYKGELIGIRDGKIIKVITEKDGLQCNRISAIKASPEYLWVGTDNGLYALQPGPPYDIVRHLTYTSGLNSNQINCLDIKNTLVWVGTTEGINYFDERDVFQQLIQQKLIITSIYNGKSSINPLIEKQILLSEKTLSINFDIIDHAGGQKPSFQYRLGNDSAWTNLENSNLYFPSIPYGDFAVNLRALSPNWKGPSNTVLSFRHPYPFYFRWWFLLAALLLFFVIVITGITAFIRHQRRRDEEKLSIQHNLLQLEQMALQGQMNPHFIFNCITAIKQYYRTGRTEKADWFTDAFAALIRRTFEMSTETFIPLGNELDYIEQYLSIEQARFNNTFDFSINKQLLLPESSISIPAMLLQPIVENAVRHGIRHLNDRRGKIDVNVYQTEEYIEIVIADNGIGRQQLPVATRPITSTTVNAKRVDILNKLFEQKIVQKTEDIFNNENHVAGTRVTILYPVSLRKRN